MTKYRKQDRDIPDDIFKMYDIRGVVGESLTVELMRDIGRAFGTDALEKSVHEVVVGCDGRISSPKLMTALIEGVRSTGSNVVNIGAVPTPVVYFATHFLGTGTGLMVTASHNPPQYNGVKMVLAGQSIYGEKIQGLRDRIIEQNFKKGSGNLTEQSVVDNYAKKVISGVRIGKRSIKVVVDCANGIAGGICPDILRRIGCEVDELYCEVDGTFPNHESDPTRIDNLQDLISRVRSTHADVGLALDGDGDRLVVVAQNGEIIWPDRLMILFARQVLENDPGSSIVYDVKCTRSLKREIEKQGGTSIMWKTGHSLLKTKLEECGGRLGGEMSGHFFFADRWYGFDDGIYASVRLCEILSNESLDVSEVFQQLPELVGTPEIRVSAEHPHDLVERFKKSADFTDSEMNYLDGVRADFADGFGLMRASNTAPEVVFRFEADTTAGLERIQDSFREVLELIDKQVAWPF